MPRCALASPRACPSFAIRRDIHSHPELSWQEHRTTAVIEQVLTEAGISTRRLQTTGLVADIGAGNPTVRVALRADIDALPVRAHRPGTEPPAAPAPATPAATMCTSPR